MQEKKTDDRSGQPLAGLRVLDMSHVIAGPLTSFYLAQMGAEVIKIESPVGGDVMRSGKTTGGGEMPEGFVALNAGKRSLAVDIRTTGENGRCIHRELPARCRSALRPRLPIYSSGKARYCLLLDLRLWPARCLVTARCLRPCHPGPHRHDDDERR
jgi:hypothetical protein